MKPNVAQKQTQTDGRSKVVPARASKKATPNRVAKATKSVPKGESNIKIRLNKNHPDKVVKLKEVLKKEDFEYIDTIKPEPKKNWWRRFINYLFD